MSPLAHHPQQCLIAILQTVGQTVRHRCKVTLTGGGLISVLSVVRASALQNSNADNLPSSESI